MKGKGPRIERETVLSFNEEQGTAWIWTASEVIYRRRLKRLGRAYLTEDGERHAEFKFPKQFTGLPRAKAKRTISDVHKARLLARPSQIEGEKGQSGVSVKPATDV